LKILLPTLRDHPEMAKILGQKARQRILERYTLTRNVTALENLYASLRLPISQPVKFLR
ncbi:MAG: glycosyltransferase family 1 protein, partial [Cyanobacteria bacterium P01_H01_bin.15]